MHRLAAIAGVTLAMCGVARAQSNEELKSLLEQAMRTIQDLQGRVTQLEQKASPAPAPAPATATAAAPAGSPTGFEAWAPVVSVGTRAVDGAPDADKARVEFYGQAMFAVGENASNAGATRHDGDVTGLRFGYATE